MKNPPALLIVDDDPAMIATLSVLLRERYPTLIAAHSVAEAQSALERHDNFDLIISDYNLPDGTGADVYYIAEKQPVPSPFLMISGSRPDLAHLECAFLPKPFSPAELRRAVARVLGGARCGAHFAPAVCWVAAVLMCMAALVGCGRGNSETGERARTRDAAAQSTGHIQASTPIEKLRFEKEDVAWSPGPFGGSYYLSDLRDPTKIAGTFVGHDPEMIRKAIDIIERFDKACPQEVLDRISADMRLWVAAGQGPEKTSQQLARRLVSEEESNLPHIAIRNFVGKWADIGKISDKYTHPAKGMVLLRQPRRVLSKRIVIDASGTIQWALLDCECEITEPKIPKQEGYIFSMPSFEANLSIGYNSDLRITNLEEELLPVAALHPPLDMVAR
jgi:CheY-like chemotaxis protein